MKTYQVQVRAYVIVNAENEMMAKANAETLLREAVESRHMKLSEDPVSYPTEEFLRTGDGYKAMGKAEAQERFHVNR